MTLRPTKLLLFVGTSIRMNSIACGMLGSHGPMGGTSSDPDNAKFYIRQHVEEAWIIYGFV